MAAYRAIRHDSTGRETRMPVDIIYGTRQDQVENTYDGFVSTMKERLLDAYADVRTSLQQAAQTQKKYYDLRVKPIKLRSRRLGLLLSCMLLPREAGQVDKEVSWSIPGSGHTIICQCNSTSSPPS